MDAKSYSTRSEVDQREVQRAIVAVAGSAARAAGLRRSDWLRQGAGDGEFAVLPPTESEVVVVDQYIRQLNAELHRYNGRLRPENKIRLRVAIHFGPLSRAELGHAGPTPIAVARLVDSSVLRTALIEAEQVNLALLLSDRVYTDTVASRATTWRPDEFRRVRVQHKEFDEPAWLWIPERDVHAMTLPEDVEAPRSVRSEAAPVLPPPVPTGAQHVVQNNFASEVHAHNGVFGIRLGAER